MSPSGKDVLFTGAALVAFAVKTDLILALLVSKGETHRLLKKEKEEEKETLLVKLVS